MVDPRSRPRLRGRVITGTSRRHHRRCASHDAAASAWRPGESPPADQPLGATRLAPATSGVTSLFHRCDDRRRLTRYPSIHAGLGAFGANLCTIAQTPFWAFAALLLPRRCGLESPAREAVGHASMPLSGAGERPRTQTAKSRRGDPGESTSPRRAATAFPCPSRRLCEPASVEDGPSLAPRNPTSGPPPGRRNPDERGPPLPPRSRPSGARCRARGSACRRSSRRSGARLRS